MVAGKMVQTLLLNSLIALAFLFVPSESAAGDPFFPLPVLSSSSEGIPGEHDGAKLLLISASSVNTTVCWNHVGSGSNPSASASFREKLAAVVCQQGGFTDGTGAYLVDVNVTVAAKALSWASSAPADLPAAAFDACPFGFWSTSQCTYGGATNMKTSACTDHKVVAVMCSAPKKTFGGPRVKSDKDSTLMIKAIVPLAALLTLWTIGYALYYYLVLYKKLKQITSDQKLRKSQMISSRRQTARGSVLLAEKMQELEKGVCTANIDKRASIMLMGSANPGLSGI